MAARFTSLGVLLLCTFSLSSAVQVRDFAPLLPHPYNLQALLYSSGNQGLGVGLGEGLGDPLAILPQYVGSLVPGQELEWTGSCFKSTRAYINLTEPTKNGSLGGGVVHVLVSFSSEGPLYIKQKSF